MDGISFWCFRSWGAWGATAEGWCGRLGTLVPLLLLLLCALRHVLAALPTSSPLGGLFSPGPLAFSILESQEMGCWGDLRCKGPPLEWMPGLSPPSPACCREPRIGAPGGSVLGLATGLRVICLG